MVKTSGINNLRSQMERTKRKPIKIGRERKKRQVPMNREVLDKEDTKSEEERDGEELETRISGRAAKATINKN